MPFWKDARNMKSSPRFTKLRDSGFTLIELLAVIIILGILSAIVVYGVSAARDQARVGACIANVKMIQDAQTAYYLKHNEYTATMSDLYDEGFLQKVEVTNADAASSEIMLGNTDPNADFWFTLAKTDAVGTTPADFTITVTDSKGQAIPGCDTARSINPTPSTSA